MRVALVHDYIKEFGGAERVLKVLSVMYPKAPIYTAFRVLGSTADQEFKDRDIKESFLAPILKIWNLYSPLRFLTPLIWGSMDLSQYDLVITSSSWYITRGFIVSDRTKVVCYCHTPPRWLYGFETSVGFTKYWPVKIYSKVIGYFMRIYDLRTSKDIKYWIANSKNVGERIRKFYKKDSIVIYPPVDVEKITKETKNITKGNYFLTVSRLVGAKGLEEIVDASNNSQFKLKIIGEAAGYSDTELKVKKANLKNVEFLGRVSDRELYKLYAGAKALICLAKDEDFGMTPVEAMAAGTPVIAFNSGGYKESVIDGVTGILIRSTNKKTILESLKKLVKIKWNKDKIVNHARLFSKEKFIGEIKKYIELVSKPD